MSHILTMPTSRGDNAVTPVVQQNYFNLPRTYTDSDYEDELSALDFQTKLNYFEKCAKRLSSELYGFAISRRTDIYSDISIARDFDRSKSVSKSSHSRFSIPACSEKPTDDKKLLEESLKDARIRYYKRMLQNLGYKEQDVDSALIKSNFFLFSAWNILEANQILSKALKDGHNDLTQSKEDVVSTNKSNKKYEVTKRSTKDLVQSTNKDIQLNEPVKNLNLKEIRVRHYAKMFTNLGYDDQQVKEALIQGEFFLFRAWDILDPNRTSP